MRLTQKLNNKADESDMMKIHTLYYHFDEAIIYLGTRVAFLDIFATRYFRLFRVYY